MTYNNYNHDEYIASNSKPQFSEGDWVSNHAQLAGQIYSMDEEFLYLVTVKGEKGTLSLNNPKFGNKLTLWQPIKGEWCWFLFDALPKLGKFLCMNDTFFESSDGYAYSKCEPFLGTLPSGCKE